MFVLQLSHVTWTFTLPSLIDILGGWKCNQSIKMLERMFILLAQINNFSCTLKLRWIMLFLFCMLYLLCFIWNASSNMLHLICFICYALSAILYLQCFICYINLDKLVLYVTLINLVLYESNEKCAKIEKKHNFLTHWGMTFEDGR